MPDFPNSQGQSLNLTIREADLDHWAEIRDLHAMAFRRLCDPAIEAQQRDAFVERIYEPDYTHALQTQDLIVAWFDRTIIGTAAWVPLDDRAAIARIASVYTSPFFGRLGIGALLVRASEERASLAGYRRFAARTFLPYAGFFERLGYSRSSHDLERIGTGTGIPVVHLKKGWGADTGNDGGNDDSS
ncbi:MAG: GNAT family N-acetyltransferase [Hyphomicrobiaceae bacterium]